MWKYKNQTLISLIGLAVGFTCFALATLWIVYEMTYDSFHKNAKQMYVVYRPFFLLSQTDYISATPYPLAAYLKATFPEIADAISLIPSYSGEKVIVEGVEIPASILSADSSFFRMFDVKILEGSRDFLIPNSKQLAITQEKARQLFGNEEPIGKTVVDIMKEELTIGAVVTGMSKHSNYAFDFIGPFDAVDANESWNYTGGENTIIELFAGTNIEAFEKKLYEQDTGEERGNLSQMTIKPLTKLRYLDPNVAREVKFQHLLLFALSGLLVILCSLFNYLTLFISRFRIRQKELALRVVCGASGASLLAMLSVEFMLTLLFAVLLGCMLTQWVHQPFLVLSDIQMDLPSIYRESLMYVVGVILVSLLVFWFILILFRRRNLNLSIRQSNKKRFRKISVVVQLVISIGFAFCTIIILKQMYFLHHTDELGFSFQNRGTVTLAMEEHSSVLAHQLKQIPEITEVVNAEGLLNLVPQNSRYMTGIDQWDDEPANAKMIAMERIYVSPEYNAFYDFQLLAGEMLTDDDPESLALLNESAVKALGWDDPVGKRFGYDDRGGGYTVKGVIQDVYNSAPTVPVLPVFYSKRSPKETWRPFSVTVLIKYRDGTWKSCKEKIEQWMGKEYAHARYTIYNAEEEYNKFLKSEAALIKLLSLVSVVCILICVFGFVSLVSLTCEERRKTIAIRKINGATVSGILSIFAKEYFLLLMIGAAIAFPAGYLMMQRWLENYVKQTSISAWVYLSIIFVLALIIVLCVGWQVYKTSIENPAEVVKQNN